MTRKGGGPHAAPSPDSNPSPSALRLLAVGLLSAAMLSFELALTRLFALAQFYHFAFMVISLALLGSGAAGSLLAVWPRIARPALWSAGFALSALATLLVLNLIPFDSYAIAWDARQIAYLLTTFIAATLPFLCAGLVVGAELSAGGAGLHRVYAANLAGSALGSLLVLPLLATLGGESALVISASLGLLASLLFTLLPLSAGRRGGRGVRLTPLVLLAASLTLFALAIVRPDWLSIRLSPYKGLSSALLAPGAQHTFSRWSVLARVDVVQSDSIHIFPGLSQNALIARPPLQAGLTLDGDNMTPITALSPADLLARDLSASVPSAVIGVLRPDASVLVLEPGGGWDVLMLLAGGAWRVTVVERNPAVIDLMLDDYDDFSGSLYFDHRLTLVAAEGRSYVRRTALPFNVVNIALSDSYHPVTSGAFSLTEDYRYTVEAMGDYLDRLAPGGILVITRWLQTPPTECLRTLASVEAALRDRGVARPADHIAAFRSLRTMTLVVAADPITPRESDLIREFVNTRGYDIVWLPDVRPDEVNLNNRLPEPVYYEAFRDLLASPAAFIAAYEYDIRPPTDDRPFFFHYFRWRQTPQVIAALGRTWQPFGGSGYLVLVVLLLLVSLLAALLILAPLALRRRPTAVDVAVSPSPQLRRGGRGVRSAALLYFAALGLGFLLVEIPLAQRFILFLGQPVTALAIVLFALLVFSGLGSLTAPRWNLRTALAALVLVAVATPPILTMLFNLVLGWPLILRLIVSVISLAPLGYLMGIPFARGAALVERLMPGLVPWAWAVNGCFSVIAAILAVMLAMSWGFTAVLWLGAAAYATALFASNRLTRLETT